MGGKRCLSLWTSGGKIIGIFKAQAKHKSRPFFVMLIASEIDFQYPYVHAAGDPSAIFVSMKAPPPITSAFFVHHLKTPPTINFLSPYPISIPISRLPNMTGPTHTSLGINPLVQVVHSRRRQNLLRSSTPPSPPNPRGSQLASALDTGYSLRFSSVKSLCTAGR